MTNFPNTSSEGWGFYEAELDENGVADLAGQVTSDHPQTINDVIRVMNMDKPLEFKKDWLVSTLDIYQDTEVYIYGTRLASAFPYDYELETENHDNVEISQIYSGRTAIETKLESMKIETSIRALKVVALGLAAVSLYKFFKGDLDDSLVYGVVSAVGYGIADAAKD